MTQQPSDWAMGEVRKIFTDWYHQCGVPCDGNDLPKLEELIALALEAARKVPDGCVRLPDGREPKVLGTLPMTADGCIVSKDADIESLWLPHPTKPEAVRIGFQYIKTFAWENIGRYYCTPEAAAEAARKGTNESTR